MLRKLKEKDADRMLEWMYDEKVCSNFRFDFSTMTKEKVLEFIANSFTDENQNFAITDDDDNYLGTISLKNISAKDKNAEYAVVIRPEIWGSGVAKTATEEIIRYGFEVLGLHRIYLNVLEENIRANKFYLKCGFAYEGKFKEHLFLQGKYKNLNWYAITNPHCK